MKMARGYSYTSLSSNSIFFLYFCGLVYNSLFSPMSLLTFRPFFDKDTPHKMLELSGRNEASALCFREKSRRLIFRLLPEHL